MADIFLKHLYNIMSALLVIIASLFLLSSSEDSDIIASIFLVGGIIIKCIEDNFQKIKS